MRVKVQDGTCVDVHVRFMEKLREVTPSEDVLVRELRRLNVGELSRYEQMQLLQGLERVWQIVRVMRLMQSYFKDKIQFGGDLILNFLFLKRVGEAPRFTFDLDSAWNKPVSVKRVLLRDFMMFNRYLADREETLQLPVSQDKTIELYTIEYNMEKDYFPDVLSLRYPVICRWTGEAFYKFVSRVTRASMDFVALSTLRDVFSEVLGVKNAKVDYVRIEVSLGRRLPYRKYRVELPFGMGSMVLNVTELEYQLASKIVNKLGKDFGGNVKSALHDILKSLLDLRLVEDVDKGKVERYVEEIGGRPLKAYRETIVRNLSALKSEGLKYWGSHHYLLVRRVRTLDDIIERVMASLF